MTAPMRPLASVALFWALGVSRLGATAPVPRASPELRFLDPADNQMLLSSFTGKVVLIEFLLINCPHCSRVAQMINHLQKDLGPQGFQPLGIAFENGISGPLVMNYARDFKVTFPVGYTSSDKVDSYLGRVGMERFQVPQIVLIDRKGVIRAQSRPVGEKGLEDETYLRSLIGTLLNEGSPSWTSEVFRISPAAILFIVGSVVVWKMKRNRGARSHS